MFIDMIRKTIPRSWRAAAALVAMLAFWPLGLDGIQALVLPGVDSVWTMFKTVIGLVAGLAATVAFYYFQSIDGDHASKKEYKSLETLNKAEEARLREERLRNASVTPAYPEIDDAHKMASGASEHLLEKTMDTSPKRISTLDS